MIRTTQLTIHSKGGHVFDLGAYSVTIDNEGSGEFLVVAENQDGTEGKVRVDAESWPELREAIDSMIQECKP